MKDLIAENEKRLLRALKSRDTKELDILLHKDLIFNRPDGTTVTKEDDLQTYNAGKIKIKSIETSDMSIKVLGDTAIVVVTIFLEGNFFDQDIERDFRYMRVWQKCETDWKLIAGSCVSMS